MSNQVDEFQGNAPGRMFKLNDPPKPKLYIAGPMRGKENGNKPAFYRAAAKLRAMGHTAVNPWELDVEEGKPIGVYMATDLPALLGCDGVALLKDWEESQGARIEALVAAECGLKVMSEFCWRSGHPWEVCGKTTEHVLRSFMGLSVPEVSGDSYAKGGPESVVMEAERLTNGPRQADYGHPEDDFSKVVGMINAAFADKLAIPLDAADWPLIMVMAKIARERNRPKRDNLVDIAGYANTLDMVHQRRGRG